MVTKTEFEAAYADYLAAGVRYQEAGAKFNAAHAEFERLTDLWNKGQLSHQAMYDAKKKYSEARREYQNAIIDWEQAHDLYFFIGAEYKRSG
ncbi:MAG: TolC family protein [Pseudomonadota bacterium]